MWGKLQTEVCLEAMDYSHSGHEASKNARVIIRPRRNQRVCVCFRSEYNIEEEVWLIQAYELRWKIQTSLDQYRE